MNKTVVAVFIRDKRLLMDQRGRSRKVYAGFLMCPSGHIEKGESLSDALRREMKEELGINVTTSTYLFTIDDVDPWSKLSFKHNFLLIDSFEGEITESKEAEGLMWLSYDDVMGRELAPIVTKLVNQLHRKNLL